ncbi:MAG: antitermination regulator [Pseudonocardiales bacterium]|nr:MAG: antitermination regulator [Pseudonocardiales bacterium]
MDPFDNHEARTMDAGVLQELLLRTDTLEDFLGELALRAARDTEHRCGITVRGEHGRPYTVASSDELTRGLDELQYAEGDGPCLEALATAVPVFVTDMASETRWGSYPRHAVEVGARSSMSYPLISGEAAIGALNLYAFEPLAPGLHMQARAAHVAEHAAGALAIALRIADHSKAIDNLRAALTSRSTIDQAIGILMAQQRCDARAAFDLLRQASQGRNVKLREVAARIVAAVDHAPPGDRRGRH